MNNSIAFVTILSQLNQNQATLCGWELKMNQDCFIYKIADKTTIWRLEQKVYIIFNHLIMIYHQTYMSWAHMLELSKGWSKLRNADTKQRAYGRGHSLEKWWETNATSGCKCQKIWRLAQGTRPLRKIL